MIRMIMMAKTERRISLCGWFFVFGFIAAVGAESFDMSDKETECLEGWIPIHRGCYKFVEAGAKWEDARDSCRSEKGDLTYIQSLKETNLLEEHLRTHYPTISTWWIGLNRQENVGTDWKWLDEGVVDTAVMPWRIQRMAGRPGKVCGVLEMFGGSMYAANDVCSRKKPYNSIMPRPTTKATTIKPTSTTITTPGPAKQGGSLNTTEDIYSKVTTSDQISQDTEPSISPPEEVETDTSPQQPNEEWTSTTEHIATTSQEVSGDPQEDGDENGQGAERNGQGSGSPETIIIDFYIVFLSLCLFLSFCH